MLEETNVPSKIRRVTASARKALLEVEIMCSERDMGDQAPARRSKGLRLVMDCNPCPRTTDHDRNKSKSRARERGRTAHTDKQIYRKRSRHTTRQDR